MTFGDLPIVGVLLGTVDGADSSAYLYQDCIGCDQANTLVGTQKIFPQFGAGNVVLDAQGAKCPLGTAEIGVRGFDFSQYTVGMVLIHILYG